MQIYMNHLATEALKSKAAARQFARMQRGLAHAATTSPKLPHPPPHRAKVEAVEVVEVPAETPVVHKGLNF